MSHVDETATMMVWAENQGKRGSSEVASCLKTIFDSKTFGAKCLILWSDGCAGQNKNYTMTGFLISLESTALLTTGFLYMDILKFQMIVTSLKLKN